MNTEQTSENIFTFKACCLLFFNIWPYIYDCFPIPKEIKKEIKKKHFYKYQKLR